jgi:hypothetical protein
MLHIVWWLADGGGLFIAIAFCATLMIMMLFDRLSCVTLLFLSIFINMNLIT